MVRIQMNALRNLSSWNRMGKPRLASAATALWLVLQPAAAAAQDVSADDGTRAAARELGERGIDAYQAGDYATADRNLEKAFRLFATATLGLWSARSRYQLGQWVEAAERYRETLRASVAVGNAAMQREVRQLALEELQALLPRVPVLTVTLVGADSSAVALSVDGKELPHELFGVARPTDPGAHHIVVSRGEARKHAEATLSEAEQRVVEMQLDPEAVAVDLPPSAVQGPRSLSISPSDSVVSTRDDSGSALRPLAITAMAIGGVGLIAGGVTALMAAARCPAGDCTSNSDMSSYSTLRTMSTVSVWTGAVLALGGLALAIVPSASSKQTATLRLSPLAVRMEGVF